MLVRLYVRATDGRTTREREREKEGARTKGSAGRRKSDRGQGKRAVNYNSTARSRTPRLTSAQTRKNISSRLFSSTSLPFSLTFSLSPERIQEQHPDGTHDSRHDRRRRYREQARIVVLERCPDLARATRLYLGYLSVSRCDRGIIVDVSDRRNFSTDFNRQTV